MHKQMHSHTQTSAWSLHFKIDNHNETWLDGISIRQRYTNSIVVGNFAFIWFIFRYVGAHTHTLMVVHVTLIVYIFIQSGENELQTTADK